MARLIAIDPDAASGPTRELLDKVRARFGVVPNMMRTMANSTAVLQGYLVFSDALEHGVLRPQLRERIALAVAETNACDYCLAAHTAIGKLVGLPDDEILASRRGSSNDPREDAAVKLARAIVQGRGNIAGDSVTRAREAGLSDAEIAEVVAAVAVNLFTNYFNKALAVTVDFPAVAAVSE